MWRRGVRANRGNFNKWCGLLVTDTQTGEEDEVIRAGLPEEGVACGLYTHTEEEEEIRAALTDGVAYEIQTHRQEKRQRTAREDGEGREGRD